MDDSLKKLMDESRKRQAEFVKKFGLTEYEFDLVMTSAVSCQCQTAGYLIRNIGDKGDASRLTYLVGCAIAYQVELHQDTERDLKDGLLEAGGNYPLAIQKALKQIGELLKGDQK